MKPLSILFVTYEYPYPDGAFGGSGIATTYYELTQGLARRGHDITVLTHSPEGESSYIDGHVKVWRIPSDPMRSDAYPRVRSRSRAVAQALEQLLQRYAFDIIQFPEFNAEGYDFFQVRSTNPLLRKPKVVVRLHSSSKPYKKQHRLLTPDEERNLRMERKQLQRCDLVISPCQATWDAVRRAVGLDQTKPVAFVGNAIDATLFSPVAKTADDRFVFGYVGKLSQAKGVDTIIQAFAQIADRCGPDAELHLVGRPKSTGDGTNYYTRLIKGLPKPIRRRIHHVNYVPRHELIQHYQSFRTFLFGSRNENVPNTLLEAMACGLPVIASRVGGVPELLGESNPSIMYDYGDVHALGEAMLTMYKDDKLRKRAGKHNRRRVAAHYDAIVILEDCEAVYRRLTGIYM